MVYASTETDVLSGAAEREWHRLQIRLRAAEQSQRKQNADQSPAHLADRGATRPGLNCSWRSVVLDAARSVPARTL